MSFSGDGRKLTGNDGTVFKCTLGTTIVGDAATPLPVGKYIITAVAAATAFPTPASGGAQVGVGYMVEVLTGVTITPAVGDDCQELENREERCDLSEWSLEFAKDEIETTTFCDGVKTYGVGKADATGSFAGIFTLGTTDDTDGFARQFMDIIRQDGVDSDLYAQQTSELYVELFSNKEGSAGDVVEYFAPINIFGMSLGGAQADAQGFSSNFRIASSEKVKPALYRMARGV